MDEILVHVSAPSTAHDDARYRAQVAAIRDYLLTTNYQGRPPPSERQVSASEASTQEAEGPAEGPAEAEDPPSQQSSSLVTHPRNLSDPDSPLRAFETSNNEAENDADPVHDPQSDPMILALPLPLPVPSPEAKSIGSALLAPRDRPQGGHDSLESLVSVIPDSQPEPDPELVSSGQESVLFLQGARDSSPPRDRHEDSPLRSPLPKRRRTGNDRELCGPSTSATATTSSLPLPLPSSDQDKSTSQKAISKPTTTSTPTHSQSPLTTLLKNTPLQIRPPQPPISSTPFTTHKTPTLAMLEQRLPPSRTYNPTRQTRPLDKLERGYWAVRIGIVSGDGGLEHGPGRRPDGSWSAAFFARFWGFLGQFVGVEGRAGWGVWCFLDKVEALSSDIGSTAAAADAGGASGSDQVQPDPDLGPEPEPEPAPEEPVSVLLKVYTWGEIAMHIYLVLYLASERQIRGLGAQWRDSREEVVIQMP